MSGPLTSSLAPLEWDEIRGMVRSRASTVLGGREAGRMEPSDEPRWAAAERSLTLECAALLRGGHRLPFRSLKDPDPILSRLTVEGIRLEAQEVYDLCLLLKNAREIGEALEKDALDGGETPLLGGLARGLPDLSPVLRTVGDHISPAGVVLDSASAELRKIRRRIVHLSEKLQRELETVIDRSNSEVFLRDEYITVRNGRFVLPIRTDSPIRVPGVLHGRSSTGLTHFVEPLATVQINNEIVALREAEEEEVDRILRFYTGLLRNASGAVHETSEAVARFDLIQARAVLGSDLGGVEPEDSPDGSLTLDDARHPGLEASLAAAGSRPVPISIAMGGDYPVLIISGPNTGGKTVALKTVGLLVLMNQAGLLVPVRAARLPHFRRVLVDIGDHQSIAANLSTFSSHMSNIGSMSNEVVPPTLVLLDEIGTGTDPEEGAALGAAILKHFHRLGALVVVTTHMSGIKSYGYSTTGVKNACVEFDEKTLQPTYRVLMGVAGSSSGIEIARRLGLPDEIVADARERLGPAAQNVDVYLRRVKETMDEVARERERLAEEVREAERETARIRSEAARQEEERARHFRQELAASVDRYEHALKEHLRGIDDKALKRRLDKEGKRRGGRVADAIEQEARERFAPGGKPVYTSPERVDPGDRVRIASLGQTGVVEASSGGRVRVQVKGKAVAVTLTDLILLERAKPAAKPPRPSRGISFEARDAESVRSELNLIGSTVDEALPRVDKFLDNAFVAGHATVRLVHGHGTGVLRRAIAEFLKEHPHVANYRLADEGQGGTAVTLVELRR